jgi:hypothetical protein
MESGRARRASEAPDARQLPLERRVLLVEQQLLVES